MKKSHILNVAIAALALFATATAFAQNPRELPPVNQPGSQFAPKAASGAAPPDTAGRLSAADRDFIRKAAEGGMKEVEMGRMGEQQAKSADVKSFGRRMVTDHSKANNELMALASRKGARVSNKAPKMEHMGGANFDKEYMSAMVKDHEKDLAEFQREASNGSDPDLKAFAAKTSKVIQKHLDLAKSTESKLK
jgi:putative membrane protein